MLHMRPILITHGKILQPLIFTNLILRRVNEYNHTTRILQPMTSIIPSEDTIITLRQLHPLPLKIVPPPIFYYQPKHIFVLDRTLFA